MAGMLVIVGSFVVILVVGALAHRFKTGKWRLKTSEEQIIGERDLGLVIGVMTMTGNNFKNIICFVRIDFSSPIIDWPDGRCRTKTLTN